MKLSGSLVIIIVLFFACRNKTPEGILEPEAMQSIYWDLLRADELVNLYAVSDTSYKREKNLDSLYTSIFAIHNISREDFLKSKIYYETHPDRLKPILDSLFIEGERLQDIPETSADTSTVKDSLPPPQRKSDTINNRIDTTLKRKPSLLRRD